MGARETGCLFVAACLLSFPVAGKPLSVSCVSYEHAETCGLKGRSVELPCSFPNNSEITGIHWKREGGGKLALATLNVLGTYSGRLELRRHNQNDCTLILTDLKVSDATLHYFTYQFGKVTGTNVTCNGGPGVRLHVLASAAIILVEEIVGGEKEGVAQWTVTEGQRITLTCVPTCAPNNAKPGYIWYKNRLKLNDTRANTRFLSLDPISNEDTGSYSCAMIGYEDLPSSSAHLSVQYSVKSTMMFTKTSAALNISTPLVLTGQSLSKLFFITILAGIMFVGLFVAIMVSCVVIKMNKRMKKKMKTVGKREEKCDPDGDIYTSLDVKGMSDEYGTLDVARRRSADDEDGCVYEISADESAGWRQETMEMS